MVTKRLWIFSWLCFSMGCYSQESKSLLPNKEVVHSFYATGNLQAAETSAVLTAIAETMQLESDRSTLLLLGNNASPTGFSDDNKVLRKNLDTVLEKLTPFLNNVVFIPGASDWKLGLKSLKSQEGYLRKATGNKHIFEPKNGCPLKKIRINDRIDLLVLDSQWALKDWDKVPNINDGCDIINKEQFYESVQDEIGKSEGKTVIIATYHPIETYGRYGSEDSFGLSAEHTNNAHYEEYRKRLLTIALGSKNVVFVSGHEQNLQYIVEKQVPVVICGAVGKTTRTHEGKYGRFRYDQEGFSKLTEYKDGSVWVSFYGISDRFKDPLFVSEVIPPQETLNVVDYHEWATPEYVYKSIYTPGELQRSGIFKTLWGEHYRNDYTTEIKVKSALLDTLYGGLETVRKGGGHQTSSIHLKGKNGKQYAMRSAKKSALRFLQYFLFKTQYLDPELDDTYFIQLLQDYWTTANPYASLTVGDLSEAIDVYHANTEMYYIPKQKALGIYNAEFGDKIFFIEERLTDGLKDVKSLGSTDKIVSSEDLLGKLQKKGKVEVNESLYIRSRLFDNILGDFDRHVDQWGWAVQDKGDGIELYEPIPRDRDQVFSNFDGFMLDALTALSPSLRFMQHYSGKYRSVKWLNDAGDDLDRAVLKNDTEADWLREAIYIKEHLTEAVIDKAFEKFPMEIDQQKIADIKKAMMGRVADVENNAKNFYTYLRSRVTVTGSDKDDHFIITRKPDGVTNITAYKEKKGDSKSEFWNVDYDRPVTKEIWVYGLDGKDIFEVVGEGNDFIPIKIIGGQNNDSYQMAIKGKVHVYDQKSKPNTFSTPIKKTLSDDYDLNSYYFKKGRKVITQTIPLLGFDPDRDVGIGASFNYTKNDLVLNPFSAKHAINALFYTATGGVEANYSGEFAHIFGDLNLGIDAGFSSPRFTKNFFGFGNETMANEDDFDFNRVRLQSVSFFPSLIYRGYHGGNFKFGVGYENIKIEQVENSFITSADVNPLVFEGVDFLNTEATYELKNFDDEAMPKSGIAMKLTTGYTANLDGNKGFGYVIPELRLTTKLDQSGIVVYATKVKAQFNLGDGYEFYQAASIGQGDGIRGFRQQRFSGQTSFYQNSDLRVSLGKIRNHILPISYGVYGGFDYGRVWLKDEESDRWHGSPGGGLFFNLAGFTTANIAYFTSGEGGRLNFGFSLAF